MHYTVSRYGYEMGEGGRQRDKGGGGGIEEKGAEFKCYLGQRQERVRKEGTRGRRRACAVGLTQTSVTRAESARRKDEENFSVCCNVKRKFLCMFSVCCLNLEIKVQSQPQTGKETTHQTLLYSRVPSSFFESAIFLTAFMKSSSMT